MMCSSSLFSIFLLKFLSLGLKIDFRAKTIDTESQNKAFFHFFNYNSGILNFEMQGLDLKLMKIDPKSSNFH